MLRAVTSHRSPDVECGERASASRLHISHSSLRFDVSIIDKHRSLGCLFRFLRFVWFVVPNSQAIPGKLLNIADSSIGGMSLVFRLVFLGFNLSTLAGF